MADHTSVFVERVDDPSLLNYLDFMDGQAEIIVQGPSLQVMPFEVEQFIEDDEYWQHVDAIRSRGYINAKPISVRPDSGGRWIVEEDDAARFMAAKYVANGFLANLLRSKVSKVRFVLHSKSLDSKSEAPHFDLSYEGD